MGSYPMTRGLPEQGSKHELIEKGWLLPEGVDGGDVKAVSDDELLVAGVAQDAGKVSSMGTVAGAMGTVITRRRMRESLCRSTSTG